jgi:hypothetical protein
LRDLLGLSASYELPNSHKVIEESFLSGTSRFAGNTSLVAPELRTQSVYHFAPPATVTVGAMTHVWLVTGAIEARYVDYTAMEVTSSASSLADRTLVNKRIKDELDRVLDWNAGAEARCRSPTRPARTHLLTFTVQGGSGRTRNTSRSAPLRRERHVSVRHRLRVRLARGEQGSADRRARQRQRRRRPDVPVHDASLCRRRLRRDSATRCLDALRLERYTILLDIIHAGSASFQMMHPWRGSRSRNAVLAATFVLRSSPVWERRKRNPSPDPARHDRHAAEKEVRQRYRRRVHPRVA